MRDADSAPRQAFAGVRTQSPDQSLYDSDLSCCAYGRGCTLFLDNGHSAEEHLQPWLNDKNCLVDRYDVRLLLHDSAQITKSLHRRANSSQIDSSDDEAGLDYERYRDLQPELGDPQAKPSVPEAGRVKVHRGSLASELASLPMTRYVGLSSEAPPTSTAYAAVPFVYDTPEAEAAPALAPAKSPTVVVDAVPDIPFVPNFAVPSSVQDHLPKSERMHKVHCLCLHTLCLPALPPALVWSPNHWWLADHPADSKVCTASWWSDRVCSASQAGCKSKLQVS